MFEYTLHVSVRYFIHQDNYTIILKFNFSTSLLLWGKNASHILPTFLLLFLFVFSPLPSPCLSLSLSRSWVNISSDFEVVHWLNSLATKAIPCWSVSNQNTLELYLEVIVCLSFRDCRLSDCYWRAKTKREQASQKTLLIMKHVLWSKCYRTNRACVRVCVYVCVCAYMYYSPLMY